MADEARLRLRFAKEGRTRFTSHLDLLRALQRGFFRAGVPLCYTAGYNPRARIRVALPLPVGQGSVCELADFETETRAGIPTPDALNPFLPQGLRAIEIEPAGPPFGEISLVKYEILFFKDGGLPGDAADSLFSLLTQKELIVKKRTKRGECETDIRPAIRSLERRESCSGELRFTALLEAQNPGLNPIYLAEAAGRCPEIAPDFAQYTRLSLHRSDGSPF